MLIWLSMIALQSSDLLEKWISRGVYVQLVHNRVCGRLRLLFGDGYDSNYSIVLHVQLVQQCRTRTRYILDVTKIQR